MSPREEDHIYDSFVDLHNSLLKDGYTELQILKYMLGWVKSSIDASVEYNYSNMAEYLQLKKELGMIDG